MFRRIGRSACLVLALAAAALCAAPAHGAAVRPGVYKIALPAPGHLSVAAVEVTVRKHGRGRPPTRLDISLPKRFSLPASVRIFYVRRRISVTRFELLLIAVNRASGRSVHEAAATQFDAGSVVLLFPSRPSFGHGCGSCGKKLPASTRCAHCWFKRASTRSAQAVNADTASAAELAPLVALLRRGWATGGDSGAVFGNPSTGAPRDPTLDGGYYDDAHAFGWNRQSLADVAPLADTVVDDLLSTQPQKLIPDLELIGQADLNGNDRIDSATTPGGGAAP